MNNSPIANVIASSARLSLNRTRKVPGKVLVAILVFSVLIFGIQISQAGSATWKSNPATSNWNTASNWTPTTIPNGLADTATFGSSTKTNISFSVATQVDGISFNPGASAFSISVNSGLTLTITEAGITNNSGIAQNFFANGGAVIGSVSQSTPGGYLSFYGDSSASNAIFAAQGATAFLGEGGGISFANNSTADHGTFSATGGTTNGAFGGTIQFVNSATAGDGTFTNSGGTVSGAFGGSTQFSDTSTAGNASFTTNGGIVGNTEGGSTVFRNTSTAGNGIFTTNGGPIGDGNASGHIVFVDTSSAAEGTFITNGGVASGAFGGSAGFTDSSTAGNAKVVANGGLNGAGGGRIIFNWNASGGTTRFKIFGNGNLDISEHNQPGITIGSIEGDGDIFLGGNNLAIGSNNLSTSFSGVAQDEGLNSTTGGSLTKIGTGTLTLSSNNIYSGGTEIRNGRLIVNNASGSGTGSGSVIVDNGAILGGSGTIQLGASASLTNNGTIAPGNSAGQFNINGNIQLTYSSNLSFEIGGTTPATQYDVLNKTDAGALTLNGKLTVTLINGFTPQPADTFTVVTTQTTLDGTFTNVKNGGRMNTADGAGSFQVTYSGANNVTLSDFGAALSPSRSRNISTRANVQTGDNVAIGGFVIKGTDAKKVIVRGLGSSLQNFGIQNPMSNPTLELHNQSSVIASNDDWKDSQQTEIQNSGFAPGNELESAIVATLQPGSYSVILSGKDNGTGVGLIEVYDLDPAANAKLANISTRALVGTGNDVLIGGINVGPNNANGSTLLVRALGPSLQPFGVQDFLADPVLELHDAQGNLFALNDNWKDSQQADIEATHFSPSNDAESAILVTLAPGAWTAVVRGVGDTSGVALVEVYQF